MRKLSMLVVLSALLGGAIEEKAQAESNYQMAKRIIYAVWPAGYAAEAMGVISCETGGTYSPTITSAGGTYRGWFQEDANHRATWGSNDNPWSQARANWRAFRANGYCWSCNSQWPVCGRPYD